MEVESDSMSERSESSIMNSLIQKLIRLLQPQTTEEFSEKNEEHPERSEDNLEKKIISILDECFLKLSYEQQESFGIDRYYRNKDFYLVPQNVAKVLLGCFAGNRFQMKRYVTFAIFGRLSEKSRFSQHHFMIWSGNEQFDSLFQVDIKIPRIYSEIRPDFLFFRNMKRENLCSNQYYLYLLRPKWPSPGEVQQNNVEIYLLDAIEMQKCLKYEETFRGIPHLKEMIDYNAKEAINPKKLYTLGECEEIRAKIENQNEDFQHAFQQSQGSNEIRNVTQNMIVMACHIKQSQEVLDEQKSTADGQTGNDPDRSVDENGNHFILDINAQGSENSFPRSPIYVPPDRSATVENQSTTSYISGSTKAESNIPRKS